MKLRESLNNPWISVIISGLALILMFLAQAASSDVGLERKLQEEELEYIRLYAWPKRITASREEILFIKPSKPVPITEGNSQRPAAAETGGEGGAAPTGSAPSNEGGN